MTEHTEQVHKEMDFLQGKMVLLQEKIHSVDASVDLDEGMCMFVCVYACVYVRARMHACI